MRAKFSDEPLKFVQSELDLNSEIPKLSVIAAEPSLQKVLYNFPLNFSIYFFQFVFYLFQV